MFNLFEWSFKLHSNSINIIIKNNKNDMGGKGWRIFLILFVGYVP